MYDAENRHTPEVAQYYDFINGKKHVIDGHICYARATDSDFIRSYIHNLINNEEAENIGSYLRIEYVDEKTGEIMAVRHRQRQNGESEKCIGQ